MTLAGMLMSVMLLSGDPRPAPPPICDGRDFKVYFAFDSTAFAFDDPEPIDNFAAIAVLSKATRITLTVHTDGAEAPGAEIDLARKRGEALAAALAARGVDPTTIVVVPVGSGTPQVLAAPGAPEPLNRWADMVQFPDPPCPSPI